MISKLKLNIEIYVNNSRLQIKLGNCKILLNFNYTNLRAFLMYYKILNGEAFRI